MRKLKLKPKEKKFLEEFIKKGTKKARALKRANILLLLHKKNTAKTISEKLGVDMDTVYNIKKKYLDGGLDSALSEKNRSGQPKKYGEKIGETTNNVAEYKALIFALRKTKQLFGKKQAKETALEIRTDSELMYKQIRGEYKILEPELQQLFIEVWNLKQDFRHVEFKKIPREENREADKLMNQALDGKIAAPKSEGGLF